MAASPLVGREQPLRQLGRALDEATAGVGRVVLISGEPGVGKTSLAAEALAEAERRGAITAVGVCWDGAGAPGLWPWVQVLRGLRSAVPASGPSAIDRLLDSTSNAGGDGESFELFDEVLRCLQAAADTAPIALLFDDLQWADTTSLRLLDFVQRHAGHLPLLLVATYRSDELASSAHPRHAEVAALAQKALTIALRGLDNDGVRQLRARLGARTTAAEAEQLRRLTGGNPFFVIESVACASPAESLGVQRAIDTRIDALGDQEREVLALASLIGRAVPDATLTAVAGDDAIAVLAALTRAGLLEADGPAHAFVHDLMREAMRARLSDDERRAIQARIVDTAAATLLPSQVAWQAVQAMPLVSAGRAVAFLEAAAADAATRLTYEAAGRQLEQAATLAEDAKDATRLTLASGHAYVRAGELARAAERFRSLLDGSAETRARAWLGLASLGEEAGTETSDIAEGLDRVDAALSADADTALRAQLLAARSRARTHSMADDRSEARRLAAEALALARASDDETTLASCLLAYHDAVWEPGSERARLELAHELAAAGRRLRDASVEAQGLVLAMVAQLELGDPGFLATHTQFDAIAETSRSPRLRYWAATRRGMLASLQGDLARAISEIDAGRDLGARIGEADAMGLWCDQRWQVARHTGDDAAVAELTGVLRQLNDPHWVVYEALAGVDAGDPERAERWAPEVAALGERWPRWAARLWLTFSAQLAIGLHDEAAMSNLVDTLTADAAQWAVLGGGVIADGPMAAWLGRLEVARGNHARGIEWFERADESARRLGSRLWSIEARGDRLVALRAIGTAASEEVTALVAEAGAVGLHPLVRRLQALGTSPVSRGNVFRLDHDVWTLVWDGVEARLPDTKGLRDIHTLLANPTVDVSASHLVAGGGAAPARSEPVLDARTKLEYRRRLDELDAAIDRATLRQDDDRLRTLEMERRALLDELRRAAGLGGRDRHLNDETEKMRKTVTARIRDTLRKLDDRHPALAAHLRESVQTGTTCRYQPAEPVRWEL